MNIIISGGTGFIGSALTRSLLADDHKVWILTRNSKIANLQKGVVPVEWDGHSIAGWEEIFSSMDAVVNLAGATVGQWPWNSIRKQAILDSRLNAGKAIVDAFQRAEKKPQTLVQASGIGYYGPKGTDLLTEKSSVGNDFMANVANQWESSVSEVESLPGVRRVIIRTSLVLDPSAGVLPLMALPVRMFAGGPLGNGKQGVSWIHIEDEVRAIRFLIENQNAIGVFNLSTPNPVSNAEFMQSLSRVLGRPYWMPAPSFVLKLALGEMSTLLLDGQFVIPERLLDIGFTFNYPKIDLAFENLYPNSR